MATVIRRNAPRREHHPAFWALIALLALALPAIAGYVSYYHSDAYLQPGTHQTDDDNE